MNPAPYSIASPSPAGAAGTSDGADAADVAAAGAAAAASAASERMTPAERASAAWLSLLSGTRLLGMFLVLPVFAVHAAGMPGGDDPLRVGLAIGIYGLTQALLQIPFGAASDRFGRKPVITLGLLIMTAGSVIAALATTLDGLTIGRALQGAGAISAAISALVADSTRDSQRTKAMAMIGATIGLSFAVSLVAAPLLYRYIGLSGILGLTGAMSLAGIGIVWWLVPDPPATKPPAEALAVPAGVAGSVFDADMLRLNFGIFCLHLVQMALFVVVPGLLVSAAGLALPDHWKVYLPVVLGSFLLMMPPLNWAERGGRLKVLYLCAIALVAAALAGFALLPATLVVLSCLLLAFFVGFNVLEAILPSLISRLAPPSRRGLALGFYNTMLALGLFCGGVTWGFVAREFGQRAVLLSAAGLLAVWIGVAAGARRWPARPARPAGPPAPAN